MQGLCFHCPGLKHLGINKLFFLLQALLLSTAKLILLVLAKDLLDGLYLHLSEVCRVGLSLRLLLEKLEVPPLFAAQPSLLLFDGISGLDTDTRSDNCRRDYCVFLDGFRVVLLRNQLALRSDLR